MKKTYIALTLIGIAASVLAAEPKRLDAATARKEIGAYRTQKLGGWLKDTREQKGKVVVVNAQTSAVETVLQKTTSVFAKGTRIDIEMQKGKFSFPKPELKGDATVFVVDDPALPMSLAALEAKWVLVNVAPLKCDKQAFFEARVSKALTRGFALLLGGGDSAYPGAIVGCVTKPEDLDNYAGIQLPVDLMDRFERYMKGYGIAPYTMSNYKKACKEGWAHAPTNKYQKAIWNQIHELPSEPITIKYDPKKGE